MTKLQGAFGSLAHIWNQSFGGLAVSKFQRCFYWVVGTQIFLIFIPILGEMIQFDSYFSDGWFNDQVVYLSVFIYTPEI